MGFNLKKAKHSLGIANKKRQYDLPLNKGSGNKFLKVLIALMTTLAMLGIASIFALSAMTDRWSSGLENKATIEIPAQNTDGTALPQDKLDALIEETFEFLITHPAVENVTRMSREDITELVEPWLGDDINMGDFPLPGIISAEFKDNVRFEKQTLAKQLHSIAPQIRLDTHESWLADVLRFTGALNLAAVFITLIIGVTTLVAVAGAVRSRMAIYHEELELLHLMGASDHYISTQLQRYMLILCLHGAVAGTILGGLILFIVGWVAGEMEISLIPDFSLNAAQIIALILLPIFVGLLGMMTARQTVLRVLSQMP